MNLHIIKYTYDTPTANIIFNNETLKKAFSFSWLRIETEYPLSLLLLSIELEVLTREFRHEKK